MNGAVGVATGFATYMFGLSSPVLWGVLAFVLNYILILGPLSGVAILFLAGLLTFDTLWLAFLPAATYLAIHGTEGAVTPLLLARRFELNPVLVIISLVFWFWMWGIAGALLAVRCSPASRSSATASARSWRLDILSAAKVTTPDSSKPKTQNAATHNAEKF